MNSTRRLWPPLLALSMTAFLAIPAGAVEPDADQDEWGFSLAPYVWALAVDGDFGADGETSDVDVSFSDILDDLSFALMGVAEVRHGRWFAGTDLLVSQLETDSRFGPTNAKSDIDAWMTKLKVVGGYRVFTQPLGTADDPRTVTVDTYAGGRFWYIDTDVKLDFPILGTRRISSDTWWIDPVVGARIRGDASERVRLTVTGDIGGFGIGSASEFTWEAQGLVGYQVSEHWTLAGGYRAIGIDRDRGSDGFDGIIHGPLIGASYSWGAGTR